LTISASEKPPIGGGGDPDRGGVSDPMGLRLFEKELLVKDMLVIGKKQVRWCWWD
jgi:hypothetical protein